MEHADVRSGKVLAGWKNKGVWWSLGEMALAGSMFGIGALFAIFSPLMALHGLGLIDARGVGLALAFVVMFFVGVILALAVRSWETQAQVKYLDECVRRLERQSLAKEHPDVKI